MQDPTLAAILAACVEKPQDRASVAALADKLVDCSAQDRVEVLSRLTDSANRLACIKAHGGYDLRDPDCGVLRYSQSFSQWAAPGNLEHGRLVERQMQYARDQAGAHLLRAIDDDHWYAIRMRRVLDEDPVNRLGRHFTLSLEVGVAPLDGGRVRKGDLPPGEVG